MFAYYSSDCIRQQTNWGVTLPAAAQAAMDPDAHGLFGLAPTGNTRSGVEITTLEPVA